MRWIDKLERRYGRYGIPNLMNIILIGQAIAWVLIQFTTPQFGYTLYSLLTLNRSGLMHGQIWRLITFLFVPSLTSSPFYLLIELYFYWWIGNSLERAWGDFRFTAYVLVGMVGAVLSCLLTGSASATGILTSMFLAYAWMWPNQQVLLFFILPIKVKWIGWVSAASIALQLLFGSVATKFSLLFGLAGFLVFFGPELVAWVRDAVYNYKRRKEWENRFK